MKTIYLIFKSSRPRQWLKNLSLFAALVFTGQLFVAEKFLIVLGAIGIFTILTSSIYLFNDIIDAPTDRLHPFKKKRPIASGELSDTKARLVAVVGFLVSLVLASNVNSFFFLSCLAYLALHIWYTVSLKKIPILDLMAIASGFMLRVFSGSLVIDAHMDVWFLLTVVSASLFLAVGKRRSEATLLESSGLLARSHRKVLGHYTHRLLDIYTGMFANTTWLTYALFSFLQPPVVPTRPKLVGLISVLPRALTAQKLLMTTVPVVIYGVMRYLQLIYEKNEGESPERVLLEDKPLLTSVILWGIMVVGILYVLV